MNASWSPRRFVLDMVVIAVVGSALGWLVFELVFGAVPVSYSIVYVTAYTILFPLFSYLVTRRRPPLVRFTPYGVELAAARSDGVFVPREAVTRVRVRGRWPIATLEVFANDAAPALPIDRNGRRLRAKRRGEVVRYRVPLAGLNESAIRTHLDMNGGEARSSADHTARTASDVGGASAGTAFVSGDGDDGPG